MRITTTYTHKIENGIEQYAFPSALNANQYHYVDREIGGRWELSVVDRGESLSFENVLTLRAELESLYEFMVKLIPAEIHRSTEPGEPDLGGIGGGL